MKKIISILLSPPLLSVIGLLLFAAIIWFVGPVVAIASIKPLALPLSRVSVIILAFLIWGLNNLRQNNANQQAAKRFTQEHGETVNPGAPTQNTNTVDTDELEDSHDIQDRLKQALRALRTRDNRFFSGHSQHIPWYIVIGAPHSGKSTFVQNTGLKAILTTQDPSGFPASNNNPPCEWWINDHALLIDTAGRFTVQDSNTSVSNKTWLKLLVALKKARPNCPLNGAILTISADDLLTRTATYITHQAQSIRRRIQELNNHLGMTLPIYVVITKCDALAGFRTFHSTLSAEASQKPLGFSLPGTGAESTIFQHKIKYLEQSFAQFTRALSAQVLSKIKTEPLQSRRDRIVQFPQQLAFLHETILDLMVQVFSPSTLEESANWRGLYFVSALHVNRESRLAANLLTVNGMSNPVETVNVEPKPFFIQDLIRSRIATESHLAHFNRSAQKKLKGLYTMAIGIAIVSFAAVLFIWMKNYQSQLTLIQNVQTHITDYKQSTWDGLNVESDWTSLASGLTKLRDLPAGYGQENNRTWYNALGLYHTQKLKNQATQAYLQALHQFFFRKLNAMLLAELNDKRQTDDDLYEALKFYLMLYHPSNMDQEAFRAWVHRLWQKHLPAENQDIYLVALNQHLQVLFDKNIPAPLMDQQRVSEARATLRATPLARRIYRRIVEDGLRQPGTLSVVSVLGPQANAIFTRKSGKPLSEGIPTLFTYKHFHSKYLLKKTALSASLHADQWIYGDVSSHTESTDVENNKRQNDKKAAQDVDVNSKPMALSQAIDDLYFADYIKYWDNYLQDLTLHPVNNAAALDNVLSALNATNRPLTHWLNTVRQHLALHRLPQADALNTLTEATDSSQLQKVARLRSLAPNNLTETASLPGKIVSDHFAGWVGYINAEPGQAFARLDTLISDLHAYWTELNTSVDFSESAYHSVSTEQDAIFTRFQQTVSSAPQPMQNMFSNLVNQGKKLISIGARRHINSRWQTEVLQPFLNTIKGRYPFDRRADTDVALADFAQFFTPDSGRADQFLQSVLKPVLTKNGSHLRWTKRMKLSEQTLKFYEHVGAIQEAYFAGEDGAIRVEFLMRPQTLDSAATAFYLNLGSQQYAYFHGPVKSSRLSWPAENSEESRITFALASRGTPVTRSKTGPWSWFRLLDEYATLRSSDSYNEIMVTFSAPGLNTTHILRSLSSANPFDSRMLSELIVPETL